MISDPIWEAADTSGPKLLVRRFEAAWRADPFRRPDVADFLPGHRPIDPASLLALLRADLVLAPRGGRTGLCRELWRSLPRPARGGARCPALRGVLPVRGAREDARDR